MPGAAQIVLALEDDEIAQAEPIELDARAHTAESGADHDGVVLRCHAEPPAMVFMNSVVMHTSRNDISFRL
ncbi:hypothetical protein NSERKGN1266_51730 [Nocardia seriolae]|nr:hypothetical protein NSERKGN1266_51730 [Nocardia seriolae]BEK96748.1 hypothetical protein NSER024013_46540 [Nocardia seriolae]